MCWAGKTRQEIETVLHDRLAECRDYRDQLRVELQRLDAVIGDAAGTADGSAAARKANTINEAIRAASFQYGTILQDFTAFIIDGRLPPESTGYEAQTQSPALVLGE